MDADCKNCGKIFRKKKPTNYFCSNECYLLLRRKDTYTDCIICNKAFIKKKSTNIFCSNKCSGISKTKKISYNCPCGKQFESHRYRQFVGRGLYCSKKCLYVYKEVKPNSGQFKPGTPSYNKGKPGMKGPLNPNWQGGITSENHKIRNSNEYKEWRKKVFERDDYTCQMCKIRGGKLNADHIKPFSKFPELRLDTNNGRTLCFECHKNTDTYLWRCK